MKSRIVVGGVVFAVLLGLFGILAGGAAGLGHGLWLIYTSQDVLITDYMALGGLAAACCNAALVTLYSILILRLAKAPVTGYTIVVIGLMSGFALFGKNLLNIQPILLGTFLYSRWKKEPFANYASVGLLATALAPAVSFFALAPGWGHLALGIAIGLVIGFLIPPISDYTYRIQNGMNLYNMGFACGLLALIIVPVLSALDRSPSPVLIWATEYRLPVAPAVVALCALEIAVGTVAGGGKKTWQSYRALLRASGRAPSDFLDHFGIGAVLVNMGVNGLAATIYLLIMGGDFNGPTVGAVFTIMGFSAFGKHIRNIAPIMIGVGIGALIIVPSPTMPSLQIAALFGTTLAPIAGHFGWPAGILAGFLHSAMVLQTGSPAEGVNLYNNGFSAGLLATILYAILTPLLRHRRAGISDEDYFEAVADREVQEEEDTVEDALDEHHTVAEGEEVLIRLPKLEELWYREKLLEDPATMSYNKHYDLDIPGYDRATGCVSFPVEVWKDWYGRWMGHEPERFYGYVVRASDGTFVGEACLHLGDRPRHYEIDVIIEDAHRGKGYGQEALRRVLEYAFGVIGAEALHNRFEERRTSAVKMHTALGFRVERGEDGMLDLTLTREDYRKNMK